VRNLKLLFNTLRYLKPIQYWGRFAWLLKQKLFKPFIAYRIHQVRAGQFPVRLHLHPRPVADAVYQQDISLKRFCFLNREYQFPGEITWNDSALEKLWLYNLHYFEYLIPLTGRTSPANFRIGKAIICEWIENNPPGRGNGWEPYPLSLRIVNWIFFFDAYFEEFRKEDQFREIFINSLYRQCAYLDWFLEYHILANHFFENIKSLLFAGIFFQHRQWVKKACRLLRKEIEEQVLPDGGHYERSPMYHSIILAGFLDIFNILKAAENVAPQYLQSVESAGETRLAASEIEKAAPKMLSWLDSLVHPDGEIALFGDSAFNIAPTYMQLRDYYARINGHYFAHSPPEGATALPESGYFIFSAPAHYFAIDGGELGVRYQPGHAHCDLFSYEYSYRGTRFIVDSGVGNYLETDTRQKARSVYSHNTVVINGWEQAQLWKVFRAGKWWVRIKEASLQETETGPFFDGGYEYSSAKVFHHRRVTFIDQKFFVIEDKITGRSLQTIESLVHFHPECSIEQKSGMIELYRGDKGICLLWDSEIAEAELKPWFYVPEFGKILQSYKLLLKPEVADQVKLYYVIAPPEHVPKGKEIVRAMNQIQTGR